MSRKLSLNAIPKIFFRFHIILWVKDYIIIIKDEKFILEIINLSISITIYKIFTDIYIELHIFMLQNSKLSL